MNIYQHSPLLDEILDQHKNSIATDFAAYHNHCYRVLNFCLALCGDVGELEKISIAVAFHDLAIWTNKSFDYLSPSRALARAYLEKNALLHWQDEIEMMIEQHHKITPYKHHSTWLVESFRQADWIDVSVGRIRFGLAPSYINEIRSQFANAGFHKRLMALTLQQMKKNPFKALPMMRL